MRTDSVPSRWVLISLAAVAAGAVLGSVGAAGLLTEGAGHPAVTGQAAAVPPARVQQTSARADVGRAVRLLAGWDRARAAAYASGDARRLAALYTRGSAARSADRAMLEEYADRGVRVRELRMQLLALEVLGATPRRMRLLVTDRVHDADAEGPRGEVRLRPDEPSTRVVVLVRREPGATWLVSAVRPRPGR